MAAGETSVALQPVPPWAILRARQWLHFALLPAAALDPAALAAAPTATLAHLARGVAIAALALAWAYGLNGVTDRATDLDPRKNPLVGHALVPRAAIALLGGAAASAIALAATAGMLPLVATLVSLAAGTLYSAGPQLKLLPVAGTLLNALLFVPLLELAPAAHPPPQRALLALAFVALLLENQLLHERADAAEDEARGARTTGRLLGDRGTARAALALGLVGAALAGVAAPTRTLAAIAAMATVGGGWIAWRGPSDVALRRALHRRFAVAAGAFLWLAALLAVGAAP